MPDLILYVATSLDGYIAKPDGSVDWLESLPETGDDYGYSDFIAGVGVVLMGRVTYEQILAFDLPYPYPGTEGYVFSRTRAGEEDAHVRFVDGEDLAGLIARLKAKQDKNLWLVGGGQLAREFLRLDLIDHIQLFILPLILGDGLPLFPPPTAQRSLALIECRSYANGIAQLSYRKQP